jgi:hypothetical protein
MSDATTLANLIARLEAATGPSRELDMAIFARLYGWSDPLVGAAVHDFRENGAPYTASIDAALTLLSDDWTAWEIRSRQRKTRFYAELSRLEEPTSLEDFRDGEGPTPAIALCIAALKARSQP